jgi:DNA-binding Xre family transcriptional regulator
MDLARASGIHNVQISKLERGITKEITGSTLRALCEALGVSPKYILGMTDDIESEQLAAATV